MIKPFNYWHILACHPRRMQISDWVFLRNVEAARFNMGIIRFDWSFALFRRPWINHNQTCIVVLWWSIKLQPQNCHNSTDISGTNQDSEGQSNSLKDTVSTLKLQNHVCCFSFKVQFTNYWRLHHMMKLIVITPTECNKSLTVLQFYSSLAFGVSIFHNVMFCHKIDLDNSPDATSGNPGQRWESSSAEFTCLHPAALVQRVPVKLRFSHTPNANVKAGAQTHVHVIYHRGSRLPHDKAEKTVVGGGDVRVRPAFPLKKLSCIKKTSITRVCVCVGVSVCVRVCVCFHSDCMDRSPERLPPFILGPDFAFAVSRHIKNTEPKKSGKRIKKVTSCVIAQELHHFYSRTSCHVNFCCRILS